MAPSPGTPGTLGDGSSRRDPPGASQGSPVLHQLHLGRGSGPERKEDTFLLLQPSLQAFVTAALDPHTLERPGGWGGGPCPREKCLRRPKC